jgi:hypothetical protein
VAVYVAAVAAGALGFVVWLGARWGPPAIGAVLFFWALHIFAESAALHLPAGTLSAGYLVLMTCAFSSPPTTAAVVGALSAVSLLEWRERRETIRIVFNAGQGAFYTGGASAMFWIVRGAGHVRPDTLIAATVAAALVALLLNTGLVAGALSLERHRRVAGVWRELVWPAPNYIGFAFAALMVGSLYREWGPLAAVFLVTPLLVLRVAHRGYTELEDAHVRTLRAFVRAVELKDPYTRGHSERVAEIALELFQELGVDEGDLRQRYYGTLLHDLGKVAVSGHILTKPGSLTWAEFESVKTHPALGAAIAGEIAFLADQVPLILFHHERLDGQGYPWGLRGDAIPFDARVLAVADTFDALTWVRPYRDALSYADALEEIRRCVGTQLDPRPVAALERIVDGGHRFSAQLGITRSAPRYAVAAHTGS